MWVIWGWEDVVIAELKVSGGLLIAPEFYRHLTNEKMYLDDSTAVARGSEASQT